MKKKLLLLFVLAFSTYIFAQSTDDLLEALKAKQIDTVQSLLEDSTDEDSEVFESLILEESRKAVKKDDLDYAYDLANIVLMYDFDNVEAQDLFTSIERAKKSKAEVAAKEAEKEKKRQEEEEQRRQIEEFQAQKQKEQEEKIEFEKAVTTVSLDNFPLSIGFVPVSMEFLNSEIANTYKGSNKFEMKYGLGLHANFGFNHPFLFIRGKANYDFYVASFAKNGMKSDLKTRFAIGSPIISDFVCLSVGYNWAKYIDSNNSVLIQSINSPTIGFGIDNLKFGDDLLISLYTDINTIIFNPKAHIDFAFSEDLTIRYDLPIKIAEKNTLYIENNTLFTANVISAEWEYAINTSIVVGVKINE